MNRRKLYESVVNMAMYTKKEMAELLGVSKSTVYRFIQENGIEYDRKKGQTMLYSESALDRLKTVVHKQYGGVSVNGGSVNESAHDEYVKQLKHENEKQAELIKWLQQQLETKESTLRLTLADNHELHKRLGIDAPSEAQNDRQSEDTTINGEVKADTKEATNAKKKHWWQLW